MNTERLLKPRVAVRAAANAFKLSANWGIASEVRKRRWTRAKLQQSHHSPVEIVVVSSAAFAVLLPSPFCLSSSERGNDGDFRVLV